MKNDGALDLHVMTGLPETDVEVLLVLEPLVLRNEKVVARDGGWARQWCHLGPIPMKTKSSTLWGQKRAR